MARQEKYPGWAAAKGNRQPVVELVDPILEVLAQQTRPIGPRRVTYWLMDAGHPVVTRLLALGKDREEGAKGYLDKRVGGTLSVMREIGLVHPDLIADAKSTTIIPSTVTGAGQYMGWLSEGLDDDYRHDRQDGQPQRIEVWTEAADTIPDLTDLCDEYGIPVVSSGGSLTLDARSELGRRMYRDYLRTEGDDPRPNVVLYLGDFDPPGLQIPERLMDAERWASRWFLYDQFDVVTPHDQRAAWGQACAVDTGLDWGLRVEPLAVEQDDLDGRSTTPVKKDLVVKSDKKGSGAYAQWWPLGEERTLQLEGISVDEVVARVRARVETLVDRVILASALEDEDEEREQVRDRLAS